MTSHSNTVSRLTVADVDTADPRKLAEMLRRECETTRHILVPAAALLAVVDECEEWRNAMDDPQMEMTRQTVEHVIGSTIRAAARAWLDAGGELSEEG